MAKAYEWLHLRNVYDGRVLGSGLLAEMLAEDETLHFLYELLTVRPPGSSISHDQMPDWLAHCAFVYRMPYRDWRLIEVQWDGDLGKSELVGAVYVTCNNEVGITLLPHARKKGIGTDAVQRLLWMHTPLPAEPGVRAGHWVANIAPGNEASLRLFRKLGFEDYQVTLVLKRGETSGRDDEGKG
jgi:RimJ/RimL family protein N-acetyltransferase